MSGDMNGIGGFFFVGTCSRLTLGSGNVVGFVDIGLAIPLDMLGPEKLKDVWIFGRIIGG